MKLPVTKELFVPFFCSTQYAFESQIRLHGNDPEDALLCMEPREVCLTGFNLFYGLNIL